MKKFILLIVIVLIFLTFAACSRSVPIVSINAEISKYSPLMSSVPGIPMKPVSGGESLPKGVKYHWVTEQGILLNWQAPDGKVDVVGKEIINDGGQVYWSVDFNEKINVSSFKIYLKVEDIKTGKVLTETNIVIDSGKEGFFLVK